MKVFIWRNEKGETEVAFEKFPNVPETAQEFDVESLDWIMFDEALGEFRVKTEDEKLQELKSQKLSELKTYVESLLAPTDYIVTKIAEAQIQNNIAEVEALMQKYATQLQRREAIRQWSKQMKQAIRDAKTLEELRSIEIRYD
ncbi:MAG: hypothetical protein P3W91_001105 [Fervidobacterium sp.]|nr:hypothetical protein [Fervidobacterium sp.]